MIFYLLYRAGYFLAMKLPVRVSYAIACRMADIWYCVSFADRKAVISNLNTITGSDIDAKNIERMARDVFRNFAKYLVDFFRFQKIDPDYIKDHISIEGIEKLDKALAKGKGVVVLSAHIGNWELGGVVLALMRQPMKAVTLTHKNKKVNEFFTKQRMTGNMVPIETTSSLRGCYDVLKIGGILALLGDRDFSKNGVLINFFGKSALMPKGPAAFGVRLGSEIVPVFMIRKNTDMFSLVFEDPVPRPESGDDVRDTEEFLKRCVAVIERYVKEYPTQWYMFKKMWNGDEKSVHTDTVI
jgi:lauroyl/myristoyl acyltransferase